MEKQISKALFEFSKKCPKVALDGKVSYGKTNFKYATLGNIIDKIRPILVDCGLFFTQQMDGEGNLVTCIIHESGEQMCSSYLIPTFQDPKLLGAYITYLKRYQLSAILGIVADEDNDMPTEKLEPKLQLLQKMNKQQKEGVLNYFKGGKNGADTIRALMAKWELSEAVCIEIQKMYNDYETTSA